MQMNKVVENKQDPPPTTPPVDPKYTVVSPHLCRKRWRKHGGSQTMYPPGSPGTQPNNSHPTNKQLMHKKPSPLTNEEPTNNDDLQTMLLCVKEHASMCKKPNLLKGNNRQIHNDGNVS